MTTAEEEADSSGDFFQAAKAKKLSPEAPSECSAGLQPGDVPP